MPHHHPFQESFWSPSSSLDVYPNFSMGFNVLHSKLKQSMAENKVITEYIKKRIAVEKSHAQNLSTILPTTNPFDNDIGGGLKRCFETVFSESQESTKEHEIRAENLHTTALHPLTQFSSRYERIISTTKQSLEFQLKQLDVACKHMEGLKTYYQNKCKQLLIIQPHYNESVKVKVGSMEFATRDHVWIWLQDLKEDHLLSREALLDWISATTYSDANAFIILQSLLQQNYLKQNDDTNSFTKMTPEPNSPSINENRKYSGFLGRWGNSNSGNNVNRIEVLAEMVEADKNYRDSVIKVETMRTQTEQMLFLHYEEMESLELERIQTIKQGI